MSSKDKDGNGRGRPKKVTAQEVLELLEEYGLLSKAAMAEMKSVCSETIGSRIKELREDGTAIVHNEHGLMLSDKEFVSETEGAEIVANYIDWQMKMIKGLSIAYHPIKPHLPQVRRTLQANYSLEERRELRKLFATMAMAITYIDVDE